MDARAPRDHGRKTRGLALPAVLLAWCLGLVVLRVVRTGTPGFLFLLWNLFLACVPLALSRALETVNRHRGSHLAQGTLLLLWLLFLPNAPYIVTDLVHVPPPSHLRTWYDTGMVLSCAATGLLVGYLSLLDVQRLVEDGFGKAAGWLMASGALLLSAFGVYLGRALRWNSWDAITRPVALLGSIADLLANARAHLHTYAVTLLFGLGLLLGYAVLQLLATTNRNAREGL
jgi:uncharacterized membrane protein